MQKKFSGEQGYKKNAISIQAVTINATIPFFGWGLYNIK